MSDPTRPFLLLPPRTKAPTPKPPKLRGFGRAPNKARQVQRLTPQFDALQQVLASKLAALEADPGGVAPEQVLVFETSIPIREFHEELAKTTGLEWLADEELRDLPPDADFADKEKPAKPQTARTYMVMGNDTALKQLVSVWEDWSNGRSIPEALKPWMSVFRNLRRIRRWDVEDRLEETGILESWREELAANLPGLDAFEIELWERTPTMRGAAFERVTTLVGRAGGQVIATSSLDAIAYNAMLVRLPASAIQAILDDRSVELVRSDDVRQFRPDGQGVRTRAAARPDQNAPATPVPAKALLEPVVGLLDGLPVENHATLSGRLVVDDPDGWSAEYEVARRHHGTAMASLILHGELGAGGVPSPHKLYCRPILRPHPLSPDNEAPPRDRLWVDVIHRAVRRAVEGEGTSKPTAPAVRIFNLSVGDPAQLFLRSMSPLARLLDWLAWKYEVLFVVSAGNHPNAEIRIPASTPEPAIERAVLRALQANVRNRRMIAPAETVNGVTVGACHEDASGGWQPTGDQERLLISTRGLPSPISGLGRGYRRAVKPDLLAPGGRVVYTRDPVATGGTISFTRSERERQPPGQRVAAASSRPGDVRGTRFTIGTSNAAALTTRMAEAAHDAVGVLASRADGEALRGIPRALWVKALLIHTAEWPTAAFDALAATLRDENNRQTFKDHATAFLGYGLARPDRATGCDPQRATLLGGGTIAPGETWAHRVPLPSVLHTFREWRRLTITLAWFTPINPRDQRYRCASVSFDPPLESPLRVDRAQVHAKAVVRGTVQHEVLEASSGAINLGEDEFLEIPVTCSAEAPGLGEKRVPYALAVTVEVAQGVQVAIYDKILERVQVKAPIKLGPPRP